MPGFVADIQALLSGGRPQKMRADGTRRKTVRTGPQRRICSTAFFAGEPPARIRRI
jgi:hypothetical protein